jgi:hypothetical protein
MSIRDTKFTILEVRRYIVDEKFPKIVEGSFKNDVFPKNIIKIIYTIDLEGIEYTSLSFIKNGDNTISAIIVEDINNTSGSNDTGHFPQQFRAVRYSDCRQYLW